MISETLDPLRFDRLYHQPLRSQLANADDMARYSSQTKSSEYVRMNFMKRLLSLTVAMSVVFSSNIVLCRVISQSSSPPYAAVLNISGCSYPCWRGIQLKKTTLSQVDAFLRPDKTITDLSFTQNGLCWNGLSWEACTSADQREKPINNIIFRPPDESNFRLGDAIALLGEPMLTVEICIVQDSSDANLGAILLFKKHVRLSVVASVQPNDPRLTPFVKVRTVSFYDDADAFFAEKVPWRGFGQAKRGQVNCK